MAPGDVVGLDCRLDYGGAGLGVGLDDLEGLLQP